MTPFSKDRMTTSHSLLNVINCWMVAIRVSSTGVYFQCHPRSCCKAKSGWKGSLKIVYVPKEDLSAGFLSLCKWKMWYGVSSLVTTVPVQYAEYSNTLCFLCNENIENKVVWHGNLQQTVAIVAEVTIASGRHPTPSSGSYVGASEQSYAISCGVSWCDSICSLHTVIASIVVK